MIKYSHSKLSTFEQCKLKYKLKYIDKIKPDFEKTIEAHLGICVHLVLEWLYKQILDEKIPKLDEIILKYTEIWKQEFKKDFKITKFNLSSEEYFNKGVKFLIDYYLENQPFQDGTIELEKEIEIHLHTNYPYKITGFIDRLSYNSQKRLYEIHDYKTAGTLPTKEKINKDRQLAIYGLAIREIYGKDKEIALIWHYLDHNKKIISSRTEQQYDYLKQEILRLIKEIESTKNFPTTKSILCDWCEFKSSCSAWNK